MRFAFPLLVCGCFSSSAPAPRATPSHWLIRIGNVAVAPTHVGLATKWDGPSVEPEQKTSFKCIAVGVVAGVAGTALAGPGTGISAGTGGAKLCEYVTSDKPVQQESDPEAPDLVVELTDGKTSYRTFTARDRYFASFDGYAFVVPSDVVPATGLELRVADLDGDATEIIDSFRIVPAAGPIARTSAAVQRFEATIEPIDLPASTRTFEVPANGGPRVAEGISIPAGMRVEIAAAGTWKIGSWHDEPIGPAGHAKESLRSDNLEAFPAANHGAAIALIGSHDRVEAVVVDRPRSLTARYEGLVVVGINDNDADNNEGTATFTITIRPPTASEWH